MRDLELVGIDLRAPQAAGQHGLDGDLLAERAPQQVGHAGDQAADIDRLRIERLAAREGEQPLGERRPPAARRASRCRPSAPAVAHRAPAPASARCRVSRLPMMTVSRLLKSCATPPVSWPMPSIFCACASCSCARCSAICASRRSVMSRVILAKPISSPVLVADAIDDDAGPEARAVLAHAPALGLELALAHGRLERARRHAGGAVFLGVEALEVLADDLRRADSP